MPRKKAISELKPWLSANPNNKEKRFIQVGNSFLFADAVKGNPEKGIEKLSDAAFRLYHCMCMESAGQRNFEFPEQTAKKYGFTNKDTFRRKVKELTDKGFIEIVENNRTCRKANVYRFSLKWKGIDSG